MLIAGGSTTVTTYFAMRKTFDGTAATGLTITDFDLQYVRSGVAPVAKVDATALAATDSAHADNKAIEIDATDQPGLYRVDWPDAAFASGVREVILTVKVVTAFTEHLRAEIDGPVDAIWDEVLTGATHNVTNSAGKRIRQIEASFVITSGTAQAGAAGTITLAAGESATTDIFAGDRVIIVAGTGVGEHGIITTYDGSTKIATMSQNWVIQPDNTSEYELAPADVDIETWQHAVVTLSSSSQKPQVDIESINDAVVVGDGNTTPWDGA